MAYIPDDEEAAAQKEEPVIEVPVTPKQKKEEPSKPVETIPIPQIIEPPAPQRKISRTKIDRMPSIPDEKEEIVPVIQEPLLSPKPLLNTFQRS